jgi:heme/copper-type cytochrome/quinol oxidase subunit 2
VILKWFQSPLLLLISLIIIVVVVVVVVVVTGFRWGNLRERSGSRWEDNIKVDLQQVRGVCAIRTNRMHYFTLNLFQ